jgi:hypothetical protein
MQLATRDPIAGSQLHKRAPCAVQHQKAAHIVRWPYGAPTTAAPCQALATSLVPSEPPPDVHKYFDRSHEVDYVVVGSGIGGEALPGQQQHCCGRCRQPLTAFACNMQDCAVVRCWHAMATLSPWWSLTTCQVTGAAAGLGHCLVSSPQLQRLCMGSGMLCSSRGGCDALGHVAAASFITCSQGASPRQATHPCLPCSAGRHWCDAA